MAIKKLSKQNHASSINRSQYAAEDGPEISIIRTQMEIARGEKLYWTDPISGAALPKPVTFSEWRDNE